MGMLAADVGDLRRDEDHALDAALEQHPHVIDLPARRALRVAEIVASRLGSAWISIAWARPAKTGFATRGSGNRSRPCSSHPGGTYRRCRIAPSTRSLVSGRTAQSRSRRATPWRG